MNRLSQSAALFTLAIATLALSLSHLHQRYLPAGFRPALIAVALLFVALSGATLWRSLSEPPAEPGQPRPSSGSRIGWAALAPVFVFALFTPAAPSADQVRDAVPRAPTATLSGDPAEISVEDYLARFAAGTSTLDGRNLSVAGNAQVTGDGWYLSVLRIRCCAADAQRLRIRVLGAPAPAPGSRVRVTGTAGHAPDGGPVLNATQVTPAAAPRSPYG